jgi:hypothetical protein
MQALRLALVATTLCCGEPICVTLRPSPGIERLAITGGCDRLEAEVNADRFVQSHGSLYCVLHRQTQPPIPDGVLREAPLLPAHALEPFRLEQAKAFAAEAYCLALALEACRLEWHPAERTARAVAHPKAKPRPPELPPPQCVLHVHPLDRVRADVLEALRRAGGEIVEIKAAQPFSFSYIGTSRLGTDLIAPVPHLVHLDRGGLEPAVRLRSHLEAQRAYHDDGRRSYRGCGRGDLFRTEGGRGVSNWSARRRIAPHEV